MCKLDDHAVAQQEPGSERLLQRPPDLRSCVRCRSHAQLAARVRLQHNVAGEGPLDGPLFCVGRGTTARTHNATNIAADDINATVAAAQEDGVKEWAISDDRASSLSADSTSVPFLLLNQPSNSGFQP
eukprot:357821-Chlamydomonas_euryale.AAC.3